MVNWIFDLDYTLYQQPNTKFSYDKLKYSPTLNMKIKGLSGKKILFTNGNFSYFKMC